jgi:hypothetical protein
VVKLRIVTTGTLLIQNNCQFFGLKSREDKHRLMHVAYSTYIIRQAKRPITVHYLFAKAWTVFIKKNGRTITAISVRMLNMPMAI